MLLSYVEIDLHQRFPLITRISGMPVPVSLFELECGPGWHSLLLVLFEKLEVIARDQHAAGGLPAELPSLGPVKVELGTLKVQVANQTVLGDLACHEAEQSAAVTCELCGEPGRLRQRGFVQVLCERHAFASLA